MKNFHRAGLFVAASIAIFILPARINEGQLSDPVNLIGSEIVIFFMSLACWYTIIFIQNHRGLKSIAKVLLSIIACCVLSNVFYFIFNPFFKDFPFKTPHKLLYIRMLMLSSRGILMSVIIIPAAYYIKTYQEAKMVREENQRLLLEKYQIQNALLENAVSERTYALQQTLGFLQDSQNELDHQFFVQSRLIASITHDIRGPFKFLLQVSEEVSKQAEMRDDEVMQLYTKELHSALENMFKFVRNLLEFTKLPLKDQVSRAQVVNLYDLVSEKVKLFEGIIGVNDNQFHINIDKSIVVKSNQSLLGIVLHNLIDNANRNTRSNNIDISTQDEPLNVTLTIANRGYPIPDEIADWINADRGSEDYTDYQAKAQDVGIGLVLIKDVCHMLAVDVSVRSYEGTTAFRLLFKK